MPASKSRHPHKHAQHHQHHPVQTSTHPKQKKSNRLLIAAILFFAVLGLCIGLFIDASSITVLLSGAVLGIAAGYFAGTLINKNLSDQ